MTNEAFGWLWICLGLATGMVLGLFFHREDWLGGYAHYRRRLIRLGHISFLGLGILNVLFEQSLTRAELAPWERSLAAMAMIVGGVSMPLCCALSAWRPALKPTFAIPVTSLLTGAVTLARGLLR